MALGLAPGHRVAVRCAFAVVFFFQAEDGIRDEVNHPPRVLRELEDVPGRLAHMDKMGVAVQVIFPTFFIRYNTSNAEAEWALITTYNRWIAEKCAPTKGRLRWAAVLPLLRPDTAVEELRWAKEHGACGIFK